MKHVLYDTCINRLTEQTEIIVEGKVVTATEETLEVQDSGENGTPETTEVSTPEVKNPTYLDLVKATWKLGYDLSSWGERDVFCVDGVNGYLRNFGLPDLREVDGNMEIADSYLEAWHRFQTWNPTGFDPANDEVDRNRLARAIHTYLRREQPKPIEVMNEWLAELGLEAFAPPRHVGRYDVSHAQTNEVTSARIQEALRREFENLNVQVTYVGRIA